MKPNPIFTATLAILAITSTAHAQLLGVQFQGGGTALASSAEAGLISQDNFNVITGMSGTDLALVNASGKSTSPTLTFSTDDSYNSGTGTGTADKTLLSGKIGSGTSTPASFTLNDLAAGTYNLIVYTVNNNNPNGMATYSVGNTTYEIHDQYGGNFNGTFIRGTTGTDATTYDTANYVEFQNIVVASGGSIKLTAANDNSYYAADFNGFQLAASTPEPSSWALLGAGLAGLLFTVRRRIGSAS